MITNCINCGAPLESKVCKYCGTDHSGKFEVNISDEFRGKLTFKGITYDVYMSDFTYKIEDDASYRDAYGMLHRVATRPTIEFNLVSY